jgi:hypothetical protein
MNRRLSLMALGAALAAAGIFLAGCDRGPDTGNEYVAPATVQSVPGTTVNRVTLTDLAVSRLGIQTTAVVAAPAGTALRSAPPTAPGTPSPAAPVATVIPLTALVYDPHGLAWTYTNPEHDTYLRVAVVVDHISGNTVVLTAGPPIGTQVVTVGGQELLGTEYGVGEE